MPKRGEVIGDYRLLELLGRGNSTVVYRAIRAGGRGEQVAIKQLQPRLSRDSKLVATLINEARIGQYLRHPNVARILEFARSADTFFLVTEYVPGYSLADILDRTTPPSAFPAPIAGEIARQLCGGLEHAHTVQNDTGQTLGIVHRDLKPTNVMVTPDAVVKIKDFGIVKATTNLLLSTLGTTKGTPAYMSPEQVQGQPLDGRSDLFSLASLIAEMLTGQPAFWSKDVHSTMLRILEVDVRGMLDEVEGIAPSFVPVLYRAWQFDPDDRFATADEMGHAVRQAQGALPEGPELADWLYPPGVVRRIVTRDPDTLPDESVVVLQTTEDIEIEIID